MFQNAPTCAPFLNIFSNLSKILIFSENLFTGVSFVKLTPPSLFWAKFWAFPKFRLKGFLLENWAQASLARTVSEPFPTNSLPLPPGSSPASKHRAAKRRVSAKKGRLVIGIQESVFHIDAVTTTVSVLKIKKYALEKYPLVVNSALQFTDIRGEHVEKVETIISSMYRPPFTC